MPTIGKKAASKIRNKLRDYKCRRAEERFVCNICKTTYDAGWVYICGEKKFHMCYDCRNQCIPGKMQRWRLYISPFESSKKKF